MVLKQGVSPPLNPYGLPLPQLWTGCHYGEDGRQGNAVPGRERALGPLGPTALGALQWEESAALRERPRRLPGGSQAVPTWSL